MGVKCETMERRSGRREKRKEKRKKRKRRNEISSRQNQKIEKLVIEGKVVQNEGRDYL